MRGTRINLANSFEVKPLEILQSISTRIVFRPYFCMGTKSPTVLRFVQFLLVGAFPKKRTRLLQSLVFFLFFYLRQTRSDER